MIKKFLPLLILSSLTVSPTFAEKPADAGNKMQPKESKSMDEKYRNKEREEAEEYKHTMGEMDKSKEFREEKLKRDREIYNEHHEKKLKEKHQEMEGETNNGLEKQRETKQMQEQKELGKGSEQGQESREQRKKWWRFWD